MWHPTVDLYSCLHLSQTLSFRVPDPPTLNGAIKIHCKDSKHPVVETAECFPMCLHETGEGWKVKSHKVLQVNKRCVKVAMWLWRTPLCPLACYYSWIDTSVHCCCFLKLNEQLNLWWGIRRLDQGEWCKHLLYYPDAEMSNKSILLQNLRETR